MDSALLNFLKLDTLNDFEWLYTDQDQLKGTLEAPTTFATFADGSEHRQIGFFGFDPYPLQQEDDHSISPFDQFKDFEDVFDNFYSWDIVNFLNCNEDAMIEAKPVANCANTTPAFDQRDNVGSTSNEAPNGINSLEFLNSTMQEEAGGKRSGRTRSAILELEEIQKHFDVPITQAAKEMKVGLTVLKKRCRELNITRWPHRKIKSLKGLIGNLKELGLTKEIEMIEEHKRMLEKIPELELTERTKKLRQACFKANHKRRSLSA